MVFPGFYESNIPMCRGACMKIKKIVKIKKYRIFRDFSWYGSLPEFKDYNLIYGWNGSGKTIRKNIPRPSTW